MTNRRFTRPQVVGDRIVSSPDGLLTFSLTRSTWGIHVERRSIVNGSSLSLAVLFTARAQFERYCASDCCRYNYPHTFRQLEAAFDELLALA